MQDPAAPLAPRITAAVLTWPFITSLVLLVMNDAWLKQAWPGVVTGKLSDFAGLAVVSLLLLAAFPRRARRVSVAVIAAFAYWKSPLSQPLIDLANDYLPFTLGRVVDGTDLLALVVLPCCQVVAQRARAISTPRPWLRRTLMPPVMLATVLAVSATSVRPSLTEFDARQRNLAAELNHTSIAAAVAEVAQKRKFRCVDCLESQTRASYDGDGVNFRYTFPDSRTVRFVIEAWPAAMFVPFSSSDREKTQDLINALRKKLAGVYTDLEFEERLAQRPR